MYSSTPLKTEFEELMATPFNEFAEQHLPELQHTVRSLYKSPTEKESAKNLLNYAIKLTGAEYGAIAFIHKKHPVFSIVAHPEGRFDYCTEQVEKHIPISVINYIFGAKRELIINSLSPYHLFYRDGYIQENKPVSIISLPIIKAGFVESVIYLDNKNFYSPFNQAQINQIKNKIANHHSLTETFE